MIDKKQLIEDLLECVNDATDTQTAMTGMTMCGILMNEVLDKALILPVVSKCDCDNHIACIVCGEEKGLDGDFWKRMKETPKIEDWLKDNFKRLDQHSFTNTHEDTVWLRSELVEVYNQLHP